MSKICKTMGFLVGWQIAGQRRKAVQKTPIAYLYNGVQLPPFPEWDRVSYPYAFICVVDDVYFLTTRKEPQECMEGGKLFWYSNYPTYTHTGGEWIEGWTSKPSISRLIIWANCDVYYNSTCGDLSGTLYLAASDPIPVYE